MSKIHLVVQEGGSTGEVYVHPYNTLRQAHSYIKSCEKASYRTVGPITLPKALAKALVADGTVEVEFYRMLEETLRAVAQLG